MFSVNCIRRQAYTFPDRTRSHHHPMNLFAKFAHHCKKSDLIAPRSHILLAVSGGVDSVVMLDLFVQLSKRRSIRLSVGHVDHQLRNESADDAKFVEELCAEKRLPFFIERVSTKKTAREKKLSIEMAARTLRYEALERLRLAAAADLIATAHTRSDQAETVLFRLLRGAGIAGLAGIAEKRGNIIRPLLGFSRQSILAYAKLRKLSWREDASNRDVSIPRNRLRHESLPMLSGQFNPNLEATLTRTARIAREAHEYMKQQAKAVLLRVAKEQSPERIVLDIHRINKYNRVIHSYVLRQAYTRLAGVGKMPSHRRIECALKLMAEGRVGARAVLSEDIGLLLDRDGLVLEKSISSSVSGDVEVGKPFPISGTSWQLLIADEAWSTKRTLPAADQYSEFVDAASIKGRLRVRWARPGDFFYPLGMQRPKKIQDFFADNKVPIRRRTTTPVLECDTGIVWVCGFRIDDRFKVTAETKKVLHLQLIQSC